MKWARTPCPGHRTPGPGSHQGASHDRTACTDLRHGDAVYQPGLRRAGDDLVDQPDPRGGPDRGPIRLGQVLELEASVDPLKSYAVLDQAFVTGGAHRYYYLPGCEAMDEDCGSRRVLV